MQTSKIKVGEHYAVSSYGGHYGRHSAVKAQVLETKVEFSGAYGGSSKKNGVRVRVLEEQKHGSLKKDEETILPSLQIIQEWDSFAAVRDADQMRVAEAKRDLDAHKQEFDRQLQPLRDLGLKVRSPTDTSYEPDTDVTAVMHNTRAAQVTMTLDGFTKLMAALNLAVDKPEPEVVTEISALESLLG